MQHPPAFPDTLRYGDAGRQQDYLDSEHDNQPWHCTGEQANHTADVGELSPTLG